MNIVTKPLLFIVLYCGAFASAFAQQQQASPSPKASAQSERSEEHTSELQSPA